MQIHPAANIVPLLDGTAYEALKADISSHGQQMPIAVWQGRILDGRNRMRACEELSIRPKTAELTSLPGNSPTMYVLSANLHRRHLTRSQLAMVGAYAREHFDAEAKLRQARKTGANDVRGDARDIAGQAVGVSGKTIDYASKVLKAGVPELIAACEAGKLAVSRAAQLVELPQEQQRMAVKTGRLPGQAFTAEGGWPAGRRSKGAGFDQLVVRAREVQGLLGSLGSAGAMVEAGHFDRAVVLSALRQLEAVANAIQSWTQAAREQLGAAAVPVHEASRQSPADAD
jgi:ParB-like chromosome segregation protein Spo0J